MEVKNKYVLFDDYSIENTTDADRFQKFFDKFVVIVFSGSGFVEMEEIFTDKEKENKKRLSENLGQPYQLRLYILKGNKKVGWFFGRQENFETFHMFNTGIFKRYRNKGIYKKMLPVILQIVREKGFHKVSSRHTVTNNNVIVPKLRAGFIISGFEISGNFGLQILLTYYFNDVRRKIMQYRAGEISPDQQLMELLKLNKINRIFLDYTFINLSQIIFLTAKNMQNDQSSQKCY